MHVDYITLIKILQDMASIISTLNTSHPNETLHLAPSLEHALDIALPGRFFFTTLIMFPRLASVR